MRSIKLFVGDQAFDCTMQPNAAQAPGPGQSSSTGTGAARKARDRHKRSQARHVAWLVGNFQAIASHHTWTRQPGHQVDAQSEALHGRHIEYLAYKVDQLRFKLGELEAELVVVKTAAAAAAVAPAS